MLYIYSPPPSSYDWSYNNPFEQEQEEEVDPSEGEGYSVFEEEEASCYSMTPSDSSATLSPNKVKVPAIQPSEDDQEELGGYEELIREYESDPHGPPLSEKVADGVNQIWKRLKDSEGYKKAASRAKPPSNVNLNRVDINEEILPILPSGSKAYDSRLRSIQGMLCKTAVPSARLLDAVVSGKLIIQGEGKEKKMLERELMDTISMVANTNALVNNYRREAIKRRLPPQYTPVLKAPEEASTTLFGDDCTENLKKAGLGARMRREMRQHQSYQQDSRSMRRGRTLTRGQRPRPYAHRGRGYANFLGEKTLINQKYESIKPIEFTNKCPPHVDLSNYRVPARLPIPRPATPWPVYPEPNPDTRGRKDSKEEIGQSTWVGQTRAFLKTLENQQFRAGQLSTKAVEWHNITSDPEILQNIRNHHIELSEIPVQKQAPRPYNLSIREQEYARREISELLGKGVISKVQHTEGEYISNIFFLEKRDSDKLRMILNIKKFNKHVEHEHFKMDTLQTALQLVEKNDWFISIDFSDAYYSIPVVESHRKYLRFQFEDVLYQYNVIPNGLKTGPRLFTKLLKVPLSILRQYHGLRIVGYLDDTIIMADNKCKTDQHGLQAATLFTKLGFHINQKKSTVVPCQKIEYLGFKIDSTTMTVRMTDSKATRLLEFIHNFRQKESYTIRNVAELIGKLLATQPGNPWALLYIKRMETEKSHALRLSQGNFDKPMTLTDWALQDLDWWEQNIEIVWAPVRRSNPDKVIYTDASKSGWGWALRDTNRQGGGRWSLEEQDLHINILELKAVYLSLQSLCKEDENIHIKIMSDNTTTVANINKQGSVRSAPCDRMARHIWNFAQSRNIWLSSAHCPGNKNIEADQASRIFSDGSEWALSIDTFQSICKKVGIRPDVDMFASRLNTKLNKYFAWQPDPDAFGIDSFTVDWGNILGFFFPPFNMVGKVLEKLESDSSIGIVVAPCWPTQPWFSKYVDMAIGKIFYFEMTIDNVYLPFRPNQQHNLAGKTKLLVTVCKSKAYKHKDYQMQPSTSSQQQGGTQHQNSTTATSRNGLSFVRKGMWYHAKEL